MPHMSPMQWTMMFMGSWIMLLVILTIYYFYNNNSLMKTNSHKHLKLKYWSWY